MSSARIEELRKKFDENPRRYFAPLANEYRKAGDFDQAIFICQEYLPQQPGHMSGHIVFGQALFEAKRLPEAKTVFETALSLDPENLIALRHLADISRGLGDNEAAKTWYERVLQADPRNEEVVAIMAELAAAPPSGAVAAAEAPTAERPASVPAPVARTLPDASSAATVELSAAAVQEMLRARQAPKQPIEPAPAPAELLTLDTTPTVEIRSGGEEPAPMEGLEPTSHAGTMDLPTIEPLGLEPTSQAGMMDLPTIEPLGLETNAAPGLEEAATAAPRPLDGLDTISLDLPSAPSSAPSLEPLSAPAVEAPAGDGLLDLDSFTLGGAPAAATSAPAPAPVDTPIDGGHDSGLIDLDFVTPEAPTPPARPTPASVPAAIMDAVTAVIPAVQDAVESAAPALMDFVDTTLPSVVETVKSTVEAVAETPTVIMEAIKRPSGGDAPPARTTPPRTSQGVPFVTETMAQLYLSQGHRAEAIDIYRKLIEARPTDSDLKARLAAIEAEERRAASAPVAPAAPAAPPARRFTGSGPSIRTVLRDLFGLDGSTSYGAASQAGMPGEVGSIDMLFARESADPLTPLAVAFDGGYVATRGTIDALFTGTQ